jgi:hypothetical protein
MDQRVFVCNPECENHLIIDFLEKLLLNASGIFKIHRENRKFGNVK